METVKVDRKEQAEYNDTLRRQFTDRDRDASKGRTPAILTLPSTATAATLTTTTTTAATTNTTMLHYSCGVCVFACQDPVRGGALSIKSPNEGGTRGSQDKEREEEGNEGENHR